MKEFYNSNADFKTYIDKYCKKHKCTVEEALKHKIIEGVYEQYKENDKRNKLCQEKDEEQCKVSQRG